jgi:hypothetical protein
MSIAVGELEGSALTILEFNGHEDLNRAGLRPVHGERKDPTFGLGVQKAPQIPAHGIEVRPGALVVLMDKNSLCVRSQCLADGLSRFSQRSATG